MVDRQPVLQLCLVLVSVIITVRNSKLAGAYGEHAKRKLQYQADSSEFTISLLRSGTTTSLINAVTGQRLSYAQFFSQTSSLHLETSLH